MATEPFLINPPKRIGRWRRRKNPVGETLVTIGANPMIRGVGQKNPWYGDSKGHRVAALMRWGRIPRGRISKAKRKRGQVSVRKPVYGRHMLWHGRRTKLWHSKHARRVAKSAALTDLGLSMFGKSRFISGKGWVTVKKKKRRKNMVMRRRQNAWFGQRRLHTIAAKKGWRRGHVFCKSKRRYRSNAPGTNPRRRRKYGYMRGYRRNPVLSLGGVVSGVSNVRSWAPLAVTGGVSAITGSLAPSLIGVVNPWARLGVQVVVAVAGSAVVEKALDSRHANAWLVVGVSMVGYQLLKQFVLVPYFPAFAVGLGEYRDYNDYYTRDTSQEVGAFPNEMSAFPNEMNDYPGVGMAQEMSSYPYDGRYGY